MVGKRSNLKDAGRWGTEDPQSEIVMIGAPGGIDTEKLKHAFEACIGTGDDARSPMLRMMRKMAEFKSCTTGV